MGEMKRENEMEAISDEDRSRIDEAIEKRRSDIAAVDWDLLNDSVGVRQAEDALRKALDKVSDSLDSGDYQTVAQLGYTDVSSSFIFLQRVMGGMQTNAYKRSDLISQIAMEVGLAVGCLPFESDGMQGRIGLRANQTIVKYVTRCISQSLAE